MHTSFFRITTSLALALSFFGAGTVFAASVKYSEFDSRPVVDQKNMLHLRNRICPIMNKENKRNIEFKHNGIVYSLCCKICLKKFKKDPDSYTADTEDLRILKESAAAE